MLKYLIIQLCDTSPSFCHYEVSAVRRLMSIDDLGNGLLWAVRRGIHPQVIYPEYDLPEEYYSVLDKYDHAAIVPFGLGEGAIVILEELHPVGCPAVLRLPMSEFLKNYKYIGEGLEACNRLNVVFTDVENFEDGMIAEYASALDYLADVVATLVKQGKHIRLNLLTDRLMLHEINSCNAGYEQITLAPDGNLYVCPAFYFGGMSGIGRVGKDPYIPNSRLYELKYAPICRNCDAFHCKRCVWLNKNLTLEVNTPGRQQCVMAHIEREASRKLLAKLRQNGESLSDIEIPQLEYLDPFEKIKI